MQPGLLLSLLVEHAQHAAEAGRRDVIGDEVPGSRRQLAQPVPVRVKTT